MEGARGEVYCGEEVEEKSVAAAAEGSYGEQTQGVAQPRNSMHVFEPVVRAPY